MNKFKIEFNNIISEINNQINDKISGINYLEKIKYPLIDKLKLLNLEFDKKFENFEVSHNYSENTLSLYFVNSLDSSSKIKHNLVDDCLLIILNGSKSIKIHEESNSINQVSLNIFSFSGIVLSKNTIISEMTSKDCVFLSIFNKKNINNQQIIHNNK